MIGIIGAMEEEVVALKSEMADAKVTEFASMTFYKGTLCGKDAVVVRSGIGKVNAAICAQILVISTDAVHHDMDATIFGDAIGQVPRMDTRTFPADPHLVELAVKANEKANPQIHTFTGRVASGDQFISSGEVKARIVENFQALCTEMEGAGIAHAAYLNKVSYVIIRAISDKADNSATMDYPEFEKQAIAHSVALVKELLPMI